MDRPRGAHLVGSVPLRDADQVFRTAAALLRDRLRRVPDGETGGRIDWILWQLPVLLEHPQLSVAAPAADDYSPNPRVSVREGEHARLTFDALGYADAAMASWEVFDGLQRSGVLPAQWRFQVSLPTPLAPVTVFVVDDDRRAVEAAYTAAMRAEVDAIVEAIPHDRLAVQWDCAVEFGLLEGVAPAHFSDVAAGVHERLVEYGTWIPGDVELGYHLCYGDLNHEHFVQPRDSSMLVDVANAISTRVPRSVQWMHLPVPRDRSDAAYFRPLDRLVLPSETELYLGLVHFTDGLEGAARRIRAAQEHAARFGIATECGLGRRPPETIPSLLEMHAALASPLMHG
jgi:hypothetical protein